MKGEESRKTNFKSVSQVVEMENVYWGMREMPELSRKSARDRMKNWNVPMPHLPPQVSTILSYITFWAYVLLNDHLQVITAYFCFWNILFIRLYLVFTNIRIRGEGQFLSPSKTPFKMINSVSALRIKFFLPFSPCRRHASSVLIKIKPKRGEEKMQSHPC